MKGTKTYQDGFVAVFTEQEAFLECIRDRLSNSFWDRGKTRNLRFAELTEDGPIAERIREKCSREGTDEGIIADTISNTGLVLRVRNEYYPVRNCAIRSILDRAGISGCGLRRVSRNVYARILNDCLKVAKGDALLRISEGKVSAVLGGDAGDYSVIDAEKLYMHTIDYLNNNFKGVSYLGGFYEHDKVSAIWELSGEKKLLEAYKKELDMLGVLGMRPEDMTPVVRITTSDTGAGRTFTRCSCVVAAQGLSCWVMLFAWSIKTELTLPIMTSSFGCSTGSTSLRSAICQSFFPWRSPTRSTA